MFMETPKNNITWKINVMAAVAVQDPDLQRLHDQDQSDETIYQRRYHSHC